MVKVLCMGITAQDTVMGVDVMPRGDGKTYAHASRTVAGGIAANAALAVARLGGQAVLVSRVGNDMAGEMVVGSLATAGVDTSRIDWLNGAATSISSVIVDRTGARMLINHADPRLFHGRPEIGDLRVDVVLTDTRWPAGAIAALEHAGALGVPGIVDFDRMPDEATAASLLELASHVVFGTQGLRSLTGLEDLPAGLAMVARRSSAWLAVTAGEHGVHYRAGEQTRLHPAFGIAAVDTLAAGDAFHAAFAIALGEGREAGASLDFAAAAAAIKCGRFGGSAGMPSRGEVEAFLGGRNL